MKVSVCIPMYNESNVIAASMTALSQYMDSHFEDYEIIVSNDGCRDGSERIVENLHLPNVVVIGDSVNRGKGYAVREAMLKATGDIRMFTDSDLAYGVEVIGEFVRQFEEHPDADVLIGSRTLHKNGYAGYTRFRKFASKIYIKLLCRVGGFRLSDSQCGCKAYRKSAAEAIFSKCTVDGFAFDFETILRAKEAGLSIVEVPVKVLCHGESKIRMLRDSFKMMKDLFRIKKQIKTEKKKNKVRR